MRQPEVGLKFYEAGGCWQNRRMVLPRAPSQRIYFPAMAARIEHPRLGTVLFDTGYAADVFEHCRRFPEKMLRIATEIEMSEERSIRFQLALEGIAPDDVKYIILSHLHADHVGGALDFPGAQIFCNAATLRRLAGRSRLGAMTEGVVRSLLPRGGIHPIVDICACPQVDTGFEIFTHGWDVFGDKSLLMTNLPGHADGQMGAFISSGGTNYFLIADACWSTESYVQCIMPSQMTRLVQHDFAAYRRTLDNLHQFHRRHPEVVIVPTHCNDTVRRLVAERNARP